MASLKVSAIALRAEIILFVEWVIFIVGLIGMGVAYSLNGKLTKNIIENTEGNYTKAHVMLISGLFMCGIYLSMLLALSIGVPVRNIRACQTWCIVSSIHVVYLAATIVVGITIMTTSTSIIQFPVAVLFGYRNYSIISIWKFAKMLQGHENGVIHAKRATNANGNVEGGGDSQDSQEGAAIWSSPTGNGSDVPSPYGFSSSEIILVQGARIL